MRLPGAVLTGGAVLGSVTLDFAAGAQRAKFVSQRSQLFAQRGDKLLASHCFVFRSWRAPLGRNLFEQVGFGQRRVRHVSNVDAEVQCPQPGAADDGDHAAQKLQHREAGAILNGRPIAGLLHFSIDVADHGVSPASFSGAPKPWCCCKAVKPNKFRSGRFSDMRDSAVRLADRQSGRADRASYSDHSIGAGELLDCREGPRQECPEVPLPASGAHWK